MTTNDDFDAASRVDRATEKAASATKGGLDAASAGADRALNAGFGKLGAVRHKMAPALRQGFEQARTWADEKADRVQHGVQAVGDRADDLADRVLGYARKEPVKALLIATAVGAGLLGLLALVARSDD